jgi:hypothetical protein
MAVACGVPASTPEPDATSSSSVDAVPVLDTSPLRIEALGVQGFVLSRGADTLLTAPLFTRQSALPAPKAKPSALADLPAPKAKSSALADLPAPKAKAADLPR